MCLNDVHFFFVSMVYSNAIGQKGFEGSAKIQLKVEKGKKRKESFL